MNQGESIVIVDDDPITVGLLETFFAAEGRKNIGAVTDPRTLERYMRCRKVDLILLDLNMPHLSGQETLKRLERDYPDIPVIVITAEDSVETAVECMKLGAFDFMTKPIDRNRLSVAVSHALEQSELRREVSELGLRMMKRELKSPDAFRAVITSDDGMRGVFHYVEAVARSGQPVLITGESGTGKELLARSIHEIGYPGRPFIAVNVAGVDDAVFTDTLFGHVRGAYTGAESVRRGLAARAEDGTLFLDEIGDLSQASQTKLLRLIQEREYYALGADEPKRFRARIIAATNADLDMRVEEGGFRRDLYYRLLTHHVHLPPLRERRGDIPLLIDHFAREAVTQFDGSQTILSGIVETGIATVLGELDYPGNVRELRSRVFDVASRLANGASPDDIITTFRRVGARPTVGDARLFLKCFGRLPTIREVEEFLIEAALEECNGNQSAASRLIGISQSTLSRKQRRERANRRRGESSPRAESDKTHRSC